MPQRPDVFRPHHYRTSQERKAEFDWRRRPKGETPLYSQRKWRRRRRLFLMRNPLCVKCTKAGKFQPAEEVDHIIPIADGGDVWDETNWQALCKPCHSSKTMTELNARRKKG